MKEYKLQTELSGNDPENKAMGNAMLNLILTFG